MSFPSIEKNNEYFLFWTIALLPVVGSGITVIVAGALIWALISLCFKRFPLKYEAEDMPLLLACGIYLAVQFFLTLYHANKASDFEAFLPSIIALIPFFLLPRFRAAPNLDYAKILFRAAFFGCIAALLISVAQRFGLNVRAEGGAGNPLIFGGVAAFLGITSLFGIKYKGLFPYTFLPIAGYFAAIASIAFSGSRGPFLAIIFSGIIFALLNLTNIRHRFKTLSLKKAVSVAVLIFIAIFFVINSPVVQRTYIEYDQLLTHDGSLNSSQIRLVYAAEGAKLFLEKPLLGHGNVNRDAKMFEVSKYLDPQKKPVKQWTITSWHRLIPKPVRAFFLNSQPKDLDTSLEQKTDENGSVQTLIHEPQQLFAPTYEYSLIKKGKHRHLHNEYLMHAVDGGAVGLIGYVCLVFGAAGFAILVSKQGQTQFMKAETWTFISVMAILSAFNTSFENDILAVSYMLILVSLCLANSTNIRKST